MGKKISKVTKQLKEVVAAPGKAIKDPFKYEDLTPGVSGAPMRLTGRTVGKFLNDKNKKPDDPGIDPLVSKTQDAQLTNAQQFRANIPQFQNKAFNQLAEQAQGQLKQNIGDIRTNASSRGLLYGGLRQGAEQTERARQSGLLAQGMSDINAGLEQQANQLDLQAIQTGLDIQHNHQTMQDQIYAQALAKQQAQGKLLGGFMGGVGSAFGGLLGGSKTGGG